MLLVNCKDSENAESIGRYFVVVLALVDCADQVRERIKRLKKLVPAKLVVKQWNQAAHEKPQQLLMFQCIKHLPLVVYQNKSNFLQELEVNALLSVLAINQKWFSDTEYCNKLVCIVVNQCFLDCVNASQHCIAAMHTVDVLLG